MCGFTGYLSLSEKETNTWTIRNMLALQRHRGPDDSGIAAIDFSESRIELLSNEETLNLKRQAELIIGFNRLSILDTSLSGHQPMISPDGKVAFMMNGEIYNAFDYRNDLTKKGYEFKSRTDTEIAFYLYLEYGIDGMLSRLNGMFAIAIFDAKQQQIYLARDRFGIKPLYFLRENGRLSFSSEIKSFKALPRFSFVLDNELISEFLLFRNVINKTLFRGIENIKPGTYLKISPSGEISSKSFYHFAEDGTESFTGSMAAESLESALNQSVSRQMISDVKLGCQLSGGVDSSLVSYYAKQALLDKQLETVSIIFDDEKYNEKTYIDHVTDQLLLKSHQFTMDGSYYFDNIDDATWHFEQPLNHPNTIGIFLLSQNAKRHVTVLLSGEGADEILGGYSRFLNLAQSPWRFKALLYNFYKAGWSPTLLQKLFLNKDNRLIMSSAFNTPQIAQKIYGDFNLDAALSQRRLILQEIKEVGIKRQRRYEIQSYLPDLLMRQDKMSMAHSIENRVPFLDNQMVTTSLNVDDSQLVALYQGRLQGKKILKELCARKFTPDFAFRKKMGFSIPLESFFNSKDFADRWHSQILPGIRKRGIFNFGYVENLMKEHGKINNSSFEELWLMFGFELWAQKYLD